MDDLQGTTDFTVIGEASNKRIEGVIMDDLVKRARAAADMMRKHKAASFEASDLDALAARIEALTAEALDWRAQVGELSDRVKVLTAERDALRAEVERLRGAEADAIDTLKAWFDRRKLAHEAIDKAVIDAASGYLRTSRVGGMPQEQSDLVLGVIEDMAYRSLFADLFARAALKDNPPLPMRGLYQDLTDEQKQRAVSVQEDESFGPDEFRRAALQEREDG
jgi:hypothetical protein